MTHVISFALITLPALVLQAKLGCSAWERMLCVSGSAYLPHRHIDRANPLLVRVRAPRSTDNRICHFGAIASESRVILLPGLKPRVVFCGKSDAADRNERGHGLGAGLGCGGEARHRASAVALLFSVCRVGSAPGSC
jgi:hypothetical protein